MNERTIGKILGPTARRISNMLVRGTVVLANAASKMQQLQVNLLADDPAESMEHFEPYGYTSKPKQGAEVLAMFFDGDRSHGVIVVAADRRYRLKGMDDGEVALYDDQGQFVHLQRDGQITVKALTKVIIDAPDAEITGNLKVGKDIVAVGDIKDQGGAKSMKGMRTAYNAHQGHTLPGSTPNQGM